MIRKRRWLSGICIMILYICAIGCHKDQYPISFEAILDLLSNSHEGEFLFTRPDLDPDDSEARIPLNSIVKHIDKANDRIEGWFYGFDSKPIIEALKRAKRRGVFIQLIGSPDQKYTELEKAGLNYSVRIRSGLQHAKVLLIDREVLISGTGNFTRSGLHYNNNAFFILKLDPTHASRLSRALFAENIRTHIPSLPYNGRAIVGPIRGDLIRSVILQKILSAKHSIRYMIFSHTDPFITSALYIKAASGVVVQGIYDNSRGDNVFETDSEGERLNFAFSALPSQVYMEGNRSVFFIDGEYHGGHIHHKTMIIDEQTVITGSFNWSASARKSNMEVIYLFQSREVAARFLDEFHRILNTSISIPRPPFPPERTPLLEARSGFEICNPGSKNTISTLFSSPGILFRAESFSAPPGCNSYPFERIDNAGIAGRGYTLPLAFDSNRIPLHEANLVYFYSGIPDAHLPCENTPCESVNLRSADPSGGWIWLEDGQFDSIRFWHPGGLTLSFPLIYYGDGYHTFSGLPSIFGDMVVFLQNKTGISAGCIQSGTTIHPMVKNFLDAMEWETGRSPRCLNLQ